MKHHTHMRSTVLVALSLVSAYVCAAEVSTGTVSSNRTKVQGPPAEILVKQITAGRSFPIRVDEISQLDSVQGNGDTLVYNYSMVKPLPPSAREELAQSLRAGSLPNACSSSNFQTLLKGGYSIRLNYALGDTTNDVHVLVKPGDCKQ